TRGEMQVERVVGRGEPAVGGAGGVGGGEVEQEVEVGGRREEGRVEGMVEGGVMLEELVEGVEMWGG
uniref:hypothetical protein n=1 Tax=Kocuria rhizophila TaxID=72000 RepID=UPI001C92F510